MTCVIAEMQHYYWSQCVHVCMPVDALCFYFATMHEYVRYASALQELNAMKPTHLTEVHTILSSTLQQRHSGVLHRSDSSTTLDSGKMAEQSKLREVKVEYCINESILVCGVNYVHSTLLLKLIPYWMQRMLLCDKLTTVSWWTQRLPFHGEYTSKCGDSVVLELHVYCFVVHTATKPIAQ